MLTKEQINELVDSFDFKTIYRTLFYLGWKHSPNGIPGMDDMKNYAIQALSCLSDSVSQVEVNGFVASRHYNEITLSYVLTTNSIYITNNNTNSINVVGDNNFIYTNGGHNS